jgi:flagellin-specific chaperone FliS
MELYKWLGNILKNMQYHHNQEIKEQITRIYHSLIRSLLERKIGKHLACVKKVITVNRE